MNNQVDLYRRDIEGCMDGNCLFQDNSAELFAVGLKMVLGIRG